MTTDQRQQTIALLRGAADNREPIEKFGADHHYPEIIIANAVFWRESTCKRTPLGDWHGSVWDEMELAADRLDQECAS